MKPMKVFFFLTVFLTAIVTSCVPANSNPQQGLKLAKFSNISAGWSHTCGLTSGGAAYCWGGNEYGQLGNNSQAALSIPGVVTSLDGKGLLSLSSISTGFVHSCGLTTTGVTLCWGRNDDGQLGNGTNIQFSSIPDVVRSPNSNRFLSISSNGSGNHTCALIKGGMAYCWGFNYNGQLGVKIPNSVISYLPVPVSAPSGENSLSFVSISPGVSHTCGLTATGTAYCWGKYVVAAESNVPVAVSSSEGGNRLSFSSISSGGSHSCGLTTSGLAYCWGNNYGGKLGNNSKMDSINPVAVLGVNSGDALKFTSISTGSGHTCGLTLTGAAYCWGLNQYGQLGNNMVTDSGIPVAVAAPDGGTNLSFSSISLGFEHTCGLTADGATYCWGRNNYGQLGNNSHTNSSIPVSVLQR
jgi:alpha-tubulin suppressor-like RCC1 family protein